MPEVSGFLECCHLLFYFPLVLKKDSISHFIMTFLYIAFVDPFSNPIPPSLNLSRADPPLPSDFLCFPVM